MSCMWNMILKNCCHNPNSTSTQLKSWVWHENDFTPPITTTIHHPPPPTTQCQQYQSYFWPDFKQTLKVGFQDQQQHEQQQQQHHQKQKQQICLRSTQSSWVKNNLGLGNLKSPKRIHIKIVLGSKILMSNNFCFDFHYIWVRYWWDICKKKQRSFILNSSLLLCLEPFKKFRVVVVL